MKTVDYYNAMADTYFEQTISSDMQSLRKAFLNHLPSNAFILDLGCGSGRDSKAFLHDGYRVEALDASIELCKKAAHFIGQPIKHMHFQDIDYEAVFDGIWACASLLHVPSSEIEHVLYKVFQALKCEGILYISVKQGRFEGEIEGRYFTHYTEASIKELLNKYSVSILELWTSIDNKPENTDNFINVLIRKK